MKNFFRKFQWKHLLTFGFVLFGFCCYASSNDVVTTVCCATCACDGWSPATCISLAQAIISLFSLLVISIGGYATFRQLRLSAEANCMTKLTSFRYMTDILQEKESRERRKRIYELFDDEGQKLKVSFEQWTDQHKKDVHDALSDLDQIGKMIKYNMLDYEFLEGWEYAIYKILRIAEPLKEEEEKAYSGLNPKTNERISHYRNGIEELLKRRREDKNKILFNFEEKCE